MKILLHFIKTLHCNLLAFPSRVYSHLLPSVPGINARSKKNKIMALESSTKEISKAAKSTTATNCCIVDELSKEDVTGFQISGPVE